jgi:hypothetical protein
MQRSLAAGSLLLGMATLGPSSSPAQELALDHEGVACIVAEQYPSLEARCQPAEAVGRARLHFRPEGGPHWYSVTMKNEGPTFTGVLPKPTKSLKRIAYYIEVTDTSFGTQRTRQFEPEVVSTEMACRDEDVAAALGSASVLVEAPAGAPPVPAGFSAIGVTTVAVGAATVPGAAGAASSATAASAGSAAGKLLPRRHDGGWFCAPIV